MRGSHQVLKKDGFPNLLTIPCNRKDVKRPLLAKLIQAAGLTEEEYLAHFRGKTPSSE
jgi:predicted RNA binding protein YcfA (HicA-like mRNA interferase family)